MARCEYEMSEADLSELLEACKPTPLLLGTGGVPLTSHPQENANRAWCRLGEKMGFKGMTVRPVPGKGPRVFTAEPSDEAA